MQRIDTMPAPLAAPKINPTLPYPTTKIKYPSPQPVASIKKSPIIPPDAQPKASTTSTQQPTQEQEGPCSFEEQQVSCNASDCARQKSNYVTGMNKKYRVEGGNTHKPIQEREGSRLGREKDHRLCQGEERERSHRGEEFTHQHLQ